MNLPNKLSLMRVACVPLLVVLMECSPAWCHWAALGIFILASLTDFLDGHLARKHHLITDFGKFIDPLADKLLVLAALMMLMERHWLPGWLVVLVLARELSVDGLRLIAMTRQQVIAAGPLGKIKTASQMLLIILLMVLRIPAFSAWYTGVCAIWVAGITLWSGVDYFVRNRWLFANAK